MVYIHYFCSLQFLHLIMCKLFLTLYISHLRRPNAWKLCKKLVLNFILGSAAIHKNEEQKSQHSVKALRFWSPNQWWKKIALKRLYYFYFFQPTQKKISA
jgi:hypothetical protein